MLLHPDDPQDPLAFRVDLSALGMGTLPLLFATAHGGHQANRLWLDLMAFDKRPDVRNPRRLAAMSLLAAGAGCLGVFIARRGIRPDELS
jgi:hypothetical protein